MSHLDARAEHLLAAGAVGAAGGALVAGHHHENDGADEGDKQDGHHHRHDDDHQPCVGLLLHQTLQLVVTIQTSQVSFLTQHSIRLETKSFRILPLTYVTKYDGT